MPAPGSANAASRDKGHTRPAVGNGIPAGSGTSSRCATFLATSHAGSKATPHPARAKLISAVALSAENRGALAIAKSTSVW